MMENKGRISKKQRYYKSPDDLPTDSSLTGLTSLLLHHFTVTHLVKRTALTTLYAVNVMWAELYYCHNHCWCKNTRCSRAVLWPGADIQELLPPTPKTTPPRLARCQLAHSQRAFPSLSDPPSWPLCSYQQLMKKHRPAQEL